MSIKDKFSANTAQKKNELLYGCTSISTCGEKRIKLYCNRLNGCKRRNGLWVLNRAKKGENDVVED